MNLQELLGDQYDAIIKKLDGKTLMINDGSYIPKSRLDEEIAKRKTLEAQLTQLQEESTKKLDALKAEYENQIKELTTSLKNFEGSEKQKAELEKLVSETNAKLKELTEKREAEKQEYEQRLQQQKLDALIEVELLRANARKTKAVRALLDESKIKLDGDNILGLSDQITALKESDPWLFGEMKLTGNDPKDADSPTPNNITFDSIKNMSVDDIVDNFDSVMSALKRSSKNLKEK